MILDSLKNAEMYYVLGEKIAKGLKFLQETDLTALPLGRNEIGDGCFGMVSSYDTKPVEEGFWEAHRKYIDIQYVFSGAERMGYANIDSLTTSKPYVEADDLHCLDGDGDIITVHEGEFTIFAPQDAHMPGLVVDSPKNVRKIIVKVPCR
jgi:YhcH/YjgK/YiaL family protein